MAIRILITLLISLAFGGYVSSEDKDAKEAKKIAEKVKKKQNVLKKLKAARTW